MQLKTDAYIDQLLLKQTIFNMNLTLRAIFGLMMAISKGILGKRHKAVLLNLLCLDAVCICLNRPIHMVNVSLNDNNQILKYQSLDPSFI